MAQETAVWSEASTQRTYQILLTYTIHSKPKVGLPRTYSLSNTLPRTYWLTLIWKFQTEE